MKRLLILAALSLAAALLIASQGTAQTATPRAFTERVTNTTTPKRDRTRPYTFTTTGRIVAPTRFCAPGVRPIPGAGNCIPLICPPGATDARYCLRPGLGVICSGKVNVRVQSRGTTISSRNVSVRANCTFRSRVTFRTLLRTRIGTLTFRARFQGNGALQPRISPNRRVRAG